MLFVFFLLFRAPCPRGCLGSGGLFSSGGAGPHCPAALGGQWAAPLITIIQILKIDTNSIILKPNNSFARGRESEVRKRGLYYDIIKWSLVIGQPRLCFVSNISWLYFFGCCDEKCRKR